ncbi:protein kinase [Devosia sp. WQ 349]|uniref:serine/threonine protein kinase n=1 Tax=Devosia sp. WQ 349K1 TaxID=2800329 RepID=UPI0019082ECD|nr:protein kinase [Devosia sp. WQ 349K1]MBK1793342.1 protein kinase [Devosia sp. WQ 349K1]
MTDNSSSWVDCPTWSERWEKIETLEGGGQGDAYKVRSLSDGNIAFLKIIKSKKDPERRARFFREATAYDSFGVDGIPRLIESNAHHHADGGYTPFIVTEFIDGSTLRSWREAQASVSVEIAVMITMRLLHILGACHVEGCVHRDVKPDNIILEDGDPAQVWLLDFGLSHHNLANIDFRTADHQEVGNRFLRLPELSAGSLSKQDPRSDISFAAGILFYVLTGDHPDVLEDGHGRLPHQRPDALAKLQRVAARQLARLRALFDEAFATRLVNRMSSTQVMHERLERIMHDQPTGASAEQDIAALREILDTNVNRHLNERITKLSEALRQVQQVFNQVRQSIGGTLSISQTGWSVDGALGVNTLTLSEPGSRDRILSVTYEVVPAGEELVVRLAEDNVYRTDLAEPDYGENFHAAVQAWLVARLITAVSDPNALPPEADIFKENRPVGTIEAAASEADRRNLPILAFVYDPSQPNRGRLGWSLNYFLQNRRTRDTMNGAFVTALVPLAAMSAISDILDQQSMEQARWVVLDQQLLPLEQQVICANAQDAEHIVDELAKRYATSAAE